MVRTSSGRLVPFDDQLPHICLCFNYPSRGVLFLLSANDIPLDPKLRWLYLFRIKYENMELLRGFLTHLDATVGLGEII